MLNPQATQEKTEPKHFVDLNSSSPLKLPATDSDFRPLKLPFVEGRQRIPAKTAVGGIAILDNPRPMKLYEDQDLKVVGSHLEAVRLVVSDRLPVFEAYDVGKKGSSTETDVDRVCSALEHILKTHKDTGVSVVNMSFGDTESIELYNKLIKAHGAKDKADLTITSENIAEHANIIRDALEECAKTNPAAAAHLRVADLISRLIKDGVAVVQGAGNSGPGTVQILSAIVPDIIAVGGINGSAPDEHSSMSSVVDTMRWYHHDYNTPGGQRFTLQGTSFSAPDAAVEVGYLLGEKLTIQQINELFRLRTKEELSGEAKEIILRDVSSFGKFVSNLKTDPKTASERLEANFPKNLMVSGRRALRSIGQASNLSAKQGFEYLSLLDSAYKGLSIPAETIDQLLKSYGELPENKRDALLDRLRARPKGFDKLETLLEYIGN